LPLPFAPLVGLLLGLGLAWASLAELSRDEGPLVASRPFAIVVAFAALLYMPAVGYFVAFHGDWAYLYVVAWHSVPSAVDFALVLVSGATLPIGFLLSAPLLRKRKLAPVAALAIASGASSLALLALSAKRIALSATYAQFHGEFGTEPIASSALGRGVLFMIIVLALGAAWSARALTSMAEGQRKS
jgi:hypothetical protein